MCAMGKTAIVSCQISFYPLYTEECIAPVKEVVIFYQRAGEKIRQIFAGYTSLPAHP